MHGERKIPLLLFNIGQRERERERELNVVVGNKSGMFLLISLKKEINYFWVFFCIKKIIMTVGP